MPVPVSSRHEGSLAERGRTAPAIPVPPSSVQSFSHPVIVSVQPSSHYRRFRVDIPTGRFVVSARPADRGARSRRAILDAALPIFERDGYAAASLNQIIAASGLTKGGFYFH